MQCCFADPGPIIGRDEVRLGRGTSWLPDLRRITACCAASGMTGLGCWRAALTGRRYGVPVEIKGRADAAAQIGVLPLRSVRSKAPRRRMLHPADQQSVARLLAPYGSP